MAEVSRTSETPRLHRCKSCSLEYEDKKPLLYGNREHYGTNGQNDSGGHCHDNERKDRGIDKWARRKLMIASALCLAFMTGEIVGGLLANSLAIVTDAAHLLTDFASFMISLFAIYLASRPATTTMSFGWHRAEVMGALISVLMIWVITGVLVYMAVERVNSGNYEIDATIMLITSAVGVAVNILMGITLHDTHGHSHGGSGHGHAHAHAHASTKDDEKSFLIHSHSDSHSHETVIDITKKEETSVHKKPKKVNINVRAAFIHVIGDFFQSLGVLTAAFIIFFKPEWKIADPICTFIFSVLVLITTINILRDTINVLMEGTPKGINFEDVRNTLKSVPGVTEIHNLRIWSLTTSKIALSVHLAVDPSVNSQEVLAAAGQLMRERYSIYECTIQMENYCQTMETCKECKGPVE